MPCPMSSAGDGDGGLARAAAGWKMAASCGYTGLFCLAQMRVSAGDWSRRRQKRNLVNWKSLERATEERRASKAAGKRRGKERDSSVTVFYLSKCVFHPTSTQPTSPLLLDVLPPEPAPSTSPR